MLTTRVLSCAAVLLAAAPAAAQTSAGKSTVLTIQPLTAMATIYSGELEQRLASGWTLGAAGSHWSFGNATELAYNSADIKLRYYPQGQALSGVAFGVQGGYTRIGATTTDASTGSRTTHRAGAPTAGVSLDYSFLLGANHSFVIALGGGAKRVFMNNDRLPDIRFNYPTGRVSIGYAF